MIVTKLSWVRSIRVYLTMVEGRFLFDSFAFEIDDVDDVDASGLELFLYLNNQSSLIRDLFTHRN